MTHHRFFLIVFPFIIVPRSHSFGHHGDTGQLTVRCHHSADLVTTAPSSTQTLIKAVMSYGSERVTSERQLLWFEPGSIPSWATFLVCLCVLQQTTLRCLYREAREESCPLLLALSFLCILSHELTLRWVNDKYDANNALVLNTSNHHCQV